MPLQYVPEDVYHPLRGINSDSNGITMRKDECIDAVNVDITPSAIVPRRGTISIEYEEYLRTSDGEILYTADGEPLLLSNVPDQDIIHYHRYVSPNFKITIFAFCESKIYQYITGTGWQEVSSGLITTPVTQWSVTSCLDNTLGTTMVAAGSLYIRPNDIMSGGNTRVFLYWDEVTQLFKNLVQRSLFPVVEEELLTGVDTAIALGRLDVTEAGKENYDSSFLSIAPALTNIYTQSTGQLAAIGSVVYSLNVGKLSLGDPADGVPINCYKLIPTDVVVDIAEIEYGDSSYVRVDGKEVSVKFLTNDYKDQQVLVNYSYYRTVAHKPMCVLAFQDALLIANTFELEAVNTYRPYRIRWSDQGSIFDTSENSYQDLIDSDISPILALHTHETTYYNTVANYVYAYKMNHIHRGTYNTNYNSSPDISVPFLSFEVAVSDGIECPRTITPIGKAQIFLGKNDVYIFDGINMQSITLDKETQNTRIRDMIFADLDIDNLDKNFAVWDQLNKKYMLFVKRWSDATYPSVCYIFNFFHNQWTRYVYPSTSAAIYTDFATAVAILDLVGNIEDLSGLIKDLGTRTQKTILFAMTKRTYVQNARGGQDKIGFLGEPGILPSYYLITRDFVGKTLQNQDRCQLVYLEAKAGEIEISYNADYSKDISTFQETSPSLEFSSKYARNQYDLDVVANNIRFLLKFYNGVEFRWLQVFTVQQEESNI